MKFLTAQESDFLKLKARAEKLQEYQGITLIVIITIITIITIVTVRYLKTSCG